MQKCSFDMLKLRADHHQQLLSRQSSRLLIKNQTQHESCCFIVTEKFRDLKAEVKYHLKEKVCQYQGQTVSSYIHTANSLVQTGQHLGNVR